MSKYIKVSTFVVIALVIVSLVTCSGLLVPGQALNLVQNPGFETGTLSPWVANGGAPVVVASDAHSGTYALRVGAATGGGEQTVGGLSPNTAYTLTGWVKSSSTKISGRIGVKDYGGAEIYETYKTTTYTQVTLNFTTGGGNTSATIYCHKVGGGNGRAYCDDFVLDNGLPTATPTAAGPTATTGPTATPAPTATSGPTATPGAGDVPITDPNIEYVGRWDKSGGSVYVSYWVGAYFRVRFTGTTVKVKLAAATNLVAHIDDLGPVLYENVPAGTLDLTTTPLAPGTHTLVVNAMFNQDELHFEGLTLDAAASTVAPETTRPLIEFMGDSITAGHMTTYYAVSDYAWITGENLGADHTQIAYSGITLVSGYHYDGWYVPGLDVAGFKARPINHCADVACENVDAWDFSYQPDIVVINIGTNDSWVSPSTPSATFEATLTTFLEDVRAVYPNAEIFVMRLLAGVYVSETEAAVAARNSAGDAKVHYIDTNRWLKRQDYSDGAHPTDAGHVKIADKLTPILAPYLP